MTRDSFIADLERAADNIETMTRADLAVLLRRAALRLRNVDVSWSDLDREYQSLIDGLNASEKSQKEPHS